ncbi:hypothetical protein NGUA18_01887 [Salmonella enterica]|nr:hypothetical protein NGUA18_01887 [Salmonella enterica]
MQAGADAPGANRRAIPQIGNELQFLLRLPSVIVEPAVGIKMVPLVQIKLLEKRGVNVVPHLTDWQVDVIHKDALIAVTDFMQNRPLRGDIIDPPLA